MSGVPEGESHCPAVYVAFSSLGFTRCCSTGFGCGARYRALLAGIESLSESWFCYGVALSHFRESVSHAVQAASRRPGDRRFKSPKTVDVSLSQAKAFRRFAEETTRTGNLTGSRADNLAGLLTMRRNLPILTIYRSTDRRSGIPS
jgi:hypothetical protein